MNFLRQKRFYYPPGGYDGNLRQRRDNEVYPQTRGND